MASFTITGLKRVDRALSTLAPRVAKKVIRQAMRAGQKIVQSEVKSLAPEQSGATRKAVKVRAGRRKRDAIRINVQIGEGDFKGEQFYASFVNYGTKKQKAQHFMQRAFETSADRAREETITQILAGVEREAVASQ